MNYSENLKIKEIKEIAKKFNLKGRTKILSFNELKRELNKQGYKKITQDPQRINRYRYKIPCNH